MLPKLLVFWCFYRQFIVICAFVLVLEDDPTRQKKSLGWVGSPSTTSGKIIFKILGNPPNKCSIQSLMFFHLSLVYSRVKTQNASDFHGCLHGYKWGYKQFSWCYFTDIHNWYFDVFWTITAQTGHHSADFLISQAVEAHLLSLLP